MRLVVGAALVRDGRVLAARRTEPAALAGGWEFPGGKVEPGETPETAVVRELAEELGVVATVVDWLQGTVNVTEDWVLRVAVCETADEPTPTEHDALRWLGPDELDEVTWLPGDLPFLDQVRRRLGL